MLKPTVLLFSIRAGWTDIAKHSLSVVYNNLFLDIVILHLEVPSLLYRYF